MLTRVLFILAGTIGLVGLAYPLIALFAARSVDNGVSRHVIVSGGVIQGLKFLFVALVLAMIAFAVRPAH